MGRQLMSNEQGYRAYLPTRSSIPGYGYIGFYGWAIVLSKTNQRACRCLKCRGVVQAGTGVYHKSYGHNGFIHIQCAKEFIYEHGENGFVENILCNLQACDLSQGRFDARLVTESIRPFDPSQGA